MFAAHPPTCPTPALFRFTHCSGSGQTKTQSDCSRLQSDYSSQTTSDSVRLIARLAKDSVMYNCQGTSFCSAYTFTCYCHQPFVSVIVFCDILSRYCHQLLRTFPCFVWFLILLCPFSIRSLCSFVCMVSRSVSSVPRNSYREREREAQTDK